MDGDDDFGRAMAGNPMFPCNQASERANVLKDISKKFGCTQAQVLLTVNYQDDKKNFELDRSFYKTLHSVMQEAMSNKKSMAIKDTKEAVKESKAKNAKVLRDSNSLPFTLSKQVSVAFTGEGRGQGHLSICV